jgi:ATP-dependent DNA helicase DinG
VIFAYENDVVEPSLSSALRMYLKGFAPSGWVNAYPGLTARPQQEEMAHEIAKALATDQSLLFEAGTGVGKSLVYLLGSILHAQSSSRKALISTHTIALQEQIRYKDIPLCRSILAANPETAQYANFKVAFLVGRSNYLCPTRLTHSISSQMELYQTAEQQALERVLHQLADYKDGFHSEIHPPLPAEIWDTINADSSTCNRKRCSPESCFYQRAKAAVQAADLVILNHSLLFSLIQAGASPEQGKGILFPNDFVVLDEAHTIPDIATDHFGMRLSSTTIERMLKGLYHERRKRGLFMKYGSADDMRSVQNSLQALHHCVYDLQSRFFTTRAWQRVRAPDDSGLPLTEHLRVTLKCVERVMDAMESGMARDEMLDQRNRLHSIIVSLESFFRGEEENNVHWMEASVKKQSAIHFRTAPLNVAPALRSALFQRQTSVILTSATLSLGDQMENFRKRSGANQLRGKVVHSPFPYKQNMRIFISDEASPTSQEYHRLEVFRTAEYVAQIACTGSGGTLVLFTSYSDLSAVYDCLANWRGQSLPTIFKQESGLSRTQLLDLYKQTPGSILLGTESFWTGIDLPGSLLTKLIIPRLPFRNPQQPVPQARHEWLIEQGKVPFVDWSLPEALLQFRQGVGRLIRGMSDQGALFILDSRVLHKSYGKRFLDVLPHNHYVKGNLANIATLLNQWQPIL